jgi:hypothetical protein
MSFYFLLFRRSLEKRKDGFALFVYQQLAWGPVGYRTAEYWFGVKQDAQVNGDAFERNLVFLRPSSNSRWVVMDLRSTFRTMSNSC